MKKLLLILLCLPILFSTCKKEEQNLSGSSGSNNNTNCPENRYMSFDISGGAGFWDFDNNMYKSVDGSHVFCQYSEESVSGSYTFLIHDNVKAHLNFTSNGIIDLEIWCEDMTTSHFRIKIEDIANKSIGVQYPLFKYNGNTSTDAYLIQNGTSAFRINYFGYPNTCGYSFYSGFIKFTKIDLLPNNDISTSAEFEFTMWAPYSSLNNNSTECVDTIIIQNGVFENLSIPQP